MKRRKKKKNKKKFAISFNDLEICSILSEQLFKDPIIIVFTIALKYWAINRKLFKYDYVFRQYSKEMIDDRVLLYLIYYFFMHKGLKEPLMAFKEEIKKGKKDGDKDKNKDKNEDKDKDQSESKDKDESEDKEKDKDKDKVIKK